MPLIEITDSGLQRLQGLDPQSNEARILSALEQSGPVQSEEMFRSLNPQQQKQVVDTLESAGVIEVSRGAVSSELIPPLEFSTGLEIRTGSIQAIPDIRIPDISIGDVKTSDDGNIVGDFSGFSGTFERPEGRVKLPQIQIPRIDLDVDDSLENA